MFSRFFNENILGPTSLDPNLYGPKNLENMFFWPKIFVTQIFCYQKFSSFQRIFGPTIFLDPTTFWTRIFGPTFFYSRSIWTKKN